MEQAIFDAWRYLGMDSSILLSKTPREFSIMMRANVERKYDEIESLATQAMMMRSAYHAKKLKHSDLFKRPKDGEVAEKKAEDMRERSEYTMKWLSQFEQFSDLGGEEETIE